MNSKKAKNTMMKKILARGVIKNERRRQDKIL